MTNPTQIKTPGGTRLTVPLAWTVWTFGGRQFWRRRDGAIVTGHTPHVWTGRRWEPVQAGRFLEAS